MYTFTFFLSLFLCGAWANPSAYLSLGRAHTCLSRPPTFVCFGANPYGAVPYETKVDAVRASEAIHVNMGGEKHGHGTEADLSGSNNHLGPFETGQGVGTVVSVSAGGHTTCAVTTGGRVACCGAHPGRSRVDATGTYSVALGGGYDNPPGPFDCGGASAGASAGNRPAEKVPLLPLGVSSAGFHPSAARVAKVAVASVGISACAMYESGDVLCWGDNGYGQLGIGSASAVGDTPGDLEAAAATPLPKPAIDIVAGGHHFCALSEDKELRCWGRLRGYGAHPAMTGLHIGDDAGEVAALAPVALNPLYPNAEVVVVAAGPTHNCIIIDYNPGTKVRGKVICFGESATGATGDESGGTDIGISTALTTATVLNFTDPDPMAPYAAFSISTGPQHTCAVFRGTSFYENNIGLIRCWGQGRLLGFDTADPDRIYGTTAGDISSLPFLSLPATALHVSAGDSHTCAMLLDGVGFKVQCWGTGGSYRLGTTDTSDRGSSEPLARSVADGSSVTPGTLAEPVMCHAWPAVMPSVGGNRITLVGPAHPALRLANKVRVLDLCGGEVLHYLTTDIEGFFPHRVWYTTKPDAPWQANIICGTTQPYPTRSIDVYAQSSTTEVKCRSVVSYKHDHPLVATTVVSTPNSGPSVGGFAPQLFAAGFELLEGASNPYCYLASDAAATVVHEVVNGAFINGKLVCRPFSPIAIGSYWMHARIHNETTQSFPLIPVSSFTVYTLSGGTVSPAQVPVTGGSPVTIGPFVGLPPTSPDRPALRFTHAGSGTQAISIGNFTLPGLTSIVADLPTDFAFMDTDPLVKFPIELTVEVAANGVDFVHVNPATHKLTLTRDPVLRRIVPSIMVSNVPTAFALEATGLTTAAAPVIMLSKDGTDVLITGSAVTVPPDTSVLGNTGTLPSTGRWKVSLAMNGVSFAATTVFLFVFSVTDVLPSSGPSDGGTNVIVRGQGFTSGSDLKCRFDMAAPVAHIDEVPATLLTESEIACETPAFPAAGSTEVMVSHDGVSYTPAIGVIFYFVTGVYNDIVPRSAPAPSFMLPGQGPPAISTVAIIGTGFYATSTPYCRFNEFVTDAVVSALRIDCDAPKEAGTYTVHVAENGENFRTRTIPSPLVFSLYYVVRVVPSVLPLETQRGVVPVTVMGESFVSGPPGEQVCRFQGWAAPSDAVPSPVDALGLIPGVPVVNPPLVQVDVTEDTVATVLGDTVVHCASPTTIGAWQPVTVEVSLAKDASGVQLFSYERRNFMYVPAPSLTAISPLSVPWQGNSRVTVYGAGLPSMTNVTEKVVIPCVIGNVTMESVAWSQDGSYIVCATPPGTESVHVGVSVNSGVSFDYYTGAELNFVRVYSLLPSLGPASGGSEVLVSGFGFLTTGSQVCKVQVNASYTALVPATVISSTQLRCTMPPQVVLSGTGKEAKAVEFSAEGSTFTTDEVLFTFYKTPTITEIKPPGSPTLATGSEVTIIGKNFATSGLPPLCTFGGNPVNFTEVDYQADGNDPSVSHLVFEPVVSSSETSVPIECTFNNGFDYTKDGRTFAVIQLRSLGVSTGPHIGGTRVEVVGTGFQTTGSEQCVFGNGTDLSFDQRLESPATVLSAGELTCVSPPRPLQADPAAGGNGVVMVDITMDKVRYTEQPLPFYYYETPDITSLDPTTGPATGGTEVTLWASPGTLNYTGEEWFCAFGSLRTNASRVVSPTDASVAGARCVAPPGVADVALTLSINGGKDSQTTGIPLKFRYTNVLFVDPSTGPSIGGTSVYVSGSGMLASPGSECRFGTVIVPADVLSDRQAKCVSPSHAPGTVQLEYRNAGAQFTGDGRTFVYYPAPTITALSPAAGPISGGSPISVLGTSFVGTMATTRCAFGQLSADAVATPSTTAVLCVSPPSKELGSNGALAVALEISVNTGFDFTTENVEFVYYLVESISPAIGPPRGGTVVVVTGAGFTKDVWDGAAGRCYWGPDLPSTPTSFVNVGTITCRTPSTNMTAPPDPFALPGAPPPPPLKKKTIHFALTVEPDTKRTAAPIQYQYVRDALVLAYTPKFSPSTGGPTLQITATTVEEGFVTYAGIKCNFAGLAVSSAAAAGGGSGNTTSSVVGSGGQSLEAGAPVAVSSLGSVAAQIEGEGKAATCTVQPSRVSGQPVPVAFSQNGVDFVIVGNITYFQVLSASPQRGPSTGGTTVMITGIGFPSPADLKKDVGSSGSLACRVSESLADVTLSTYVSDSMVICVTSAPRAKVVISSRSSSSSSSSSPPHHRGIGDSTAARSMINVTEGPALRALDAAGSPLDGDRFVSTAHHDDLVDASSYGYNYDSDSDDDTAAVEVDGKRARFQARERVFLRTYTALSANGLHFSEPAPESATDFVFYYMPDVSALVPERGPGSGGTVVTLYGGGFSKEGTQCRFGGASGEGDHTPVQATYISDSKITCVTTMHPYGIADIDLSLNGQQYARRTQWPRFTYEECLIGEAAASFGDPCVKCPVGEISKVRGAKRCNKCNTRSWVNETGQSECLPCPENTIINVIDRDSIELCECEVGYYTVERRTGTPCVPCPVGAQCVGGTAPPVALPGYWVESPESQTFLFCDHPTSCPGVQPDTCSLGYRGRLCADCSPGFFRTGRNCRPCPSYAKFLILALPAYVIFVAVLIWTTVGSRMSAYAGLLTVMTFFFQGLSILARLKLNWPRRLHDAFSVTSSLFSMNIDILALECADPTISFQVRWVAMMGSPVIFLLAFVFAATVSALRRSLARKLTPGRPGSRRGMPRHFLLNAYLRWLSLMYLVLVVTSLQLFDCTKQPDGKLTLDASPNLVCFTEPWWKRLMPVGAFAMAAYGLLIPLGILLVLHGSRNRRRMPMTTARCGSLFAYYRFFWWEPMAILEKFCVATALTYFSAKIDIQIIMLLLVTVTGLALHVLVKPFYIERHNTLATLLRWGTVMLLILGSIFRSGQFPDEKVEQLVEAMGFMTMLVCFLACVVSLALDIRIQHRAKKYFGKSEDGQTTTDDHLTALCHPQGRTDLMEWLGTTEDAVVAMDTVQVFAKLYDYLMEAKIKPIHVEGGRVADEVIDEFTSGIFYDKAIPYVRSYVIETADRLEQQSSSGTEEELRSFVGVIGALKRHGFLRDIALGR